jgi:hypothetical protein
MFFANPLDDVDESARIFSLSPEMITISINSQDITSREFTLTPISDYVAEDVKIKGIIGY